jgi:hypothetical protein
MAVKQVLIAFDQLLNTVHGGWADETISSRAWRLRHRWPYKAYRVMLDVLFFFDPEHCKASYESERLRLQSPPELRA